MFSHCVALGHPKKIHSWNRWTWYQDKDRVQWILVKPRDSLILSEILLTLCNTTAKGILRNGREPKKKEKKSCILPFDFFHLSSRTIFIYWLKYHTYGKLASNMASKKGNLGSDFLYVQEQVFHKAENAPALGVYLPRIHNVGWNESLKLISSNLLHKSENLSIISLSINHSPCSWISICTYECSQEKVNSIFLCIGLTSPPVYLIICLFRWI